MIDVFNQPSLHLHMNSAGASTTRADMDFVEMAVRHVKNRDAEIILMVRRTASFLDVKRSLARPVGDETFMRRAQLVREIDGARQGDKLYSPYKDESPIGDVREVFLLGAELSIADEASDDGESGDDSSEAEMTPGMLSEIHRGPAFQPERPTEMNDEAVRGEKLQAPVMRQILKRLMVAVEQPDFKEAVANMSKKMASNMSGMLFRGVWHKIAAEFGFSDENKLFEQVVATVQQESRDPEVRELAMELENLFHVQPGSLFAISSTEPRKKEEQADEPLILSRERIKEMLKLYVEICEQPKTMKIAESLHNSGGFVAQIGLTQLIGNITTEVASTMGLDDGWVFDRTVHAVRQHGADFFIRTKVHMIEERLRVEPGRFFGLPKTKARTSLEMPTVNTKTSLPPPRDVQVLVKHATNDGEVFLTLPSGCTMREIRMTLADVLKRPEILEKGQLGEVAGTVDSKFLPFRDDEKLNGRNELFFVGAELYVPLSSESESEPEETQEPSAPTIRNLLGKTSSELPSIQVVASGGGSNITKNEVLQLQQELKRGFSEQVFQQSLQRIEQTQQKDTTQYRQDRIQLCLTVQSRVLPKYGFEGDYNGVIQMMTVLVRTPELNNDPEIKANVDELNALLMVKEEPKQVPKQPHGPPALSSQPTEVKQNASKRTWITVRHAILESEAIKISVQINSTMRDVKKSLAETLGRPEIFKRGRFVHRVGDNGTIFQSVSDTGRLGNHRTLLFLGVDDLMPAAKSPEEKLDAGHNRNSGITAVPLTIERALALQQDLIAGFSNEEFQEKFIALKRTITNKDKKTFNFERQQLILSVQSPLLPKYGFQGNMTGVLAMLDQFERQEINTNDEIQQNKVLIDRILFSEEGPESNQEQQEQTTKLEPPENVHVRVQRYMEDGLGKEVVHVTVLSNATMHDVKVAVAQTLNKDEILDEVCLVKKHGIMLKYDDSEPLGHRRRLFFAKKQTK